MHLTRLSAGQLLLDVQELVVYARKYTREATTRVTRREFQTHVAFRTRKRSCLLEDRSRRRKASGGGATV